MPTTNNNWPTPVATDLVKDGWEAIKDLGDAIDTTLGVYAPPATGLTLINTTSFSGVASASLPADTFTSTYRNYRVIIELTGAVATGGVNLRFRTAGSDNTNSNYQEQRIYATGATVAGQRATNQAQFGTFSITTSKHFWIMDIIAPKATDPTLVSGHCGYAVNSTSLEWTDFVASFNTTTSFDSMSVYAASTNITGSIRAFGYND
jgi:hypothetical protein